MNNTYRPGTCGHVKKTLLILLCITVALGFSFALGGQQANAAKKKMKLPTNATRYHKDDDGNWVKDWKTTYKYNKKKDLVKTTRTFYEDGKKVDSATIKLSYKYKKGKKKKCTVKNTKKDYEKYTITFDKKQRIAKLKEWDEDGVQTYTYKYGKKNSIKYIKRNTTNTEFTNRSVTDTYKTTFKKGNLAKYVINGASFYGDGWTDVKTFNSKGFITSWTQQDIPEKANYSYKKSKGLIKTMTNKTVRYYDEPEYIQHEQSKIVYKYGKKKVSKTAYSHIINSDEYTILYYLRYQGDRI